MEKSTKAEREQAVIQGIANQELEMGGKQVDPKFRALLDRYIDGEISLTDVGAEVEREYGVVGLFSKNLMP